MARLVPGAACLSSALLLAACTSDPGGERACVPGLVVACSCADSEGAQACGPDGKFEACACGQTGGVPDPTGQADFLIDFGAVAIGDHARAVFPLRNTGATAIQFQAEPVEVPFQVGNGAPLLLAPGESGELVWTFWPAALGSSSLVGRVTTSGGAFTVRLFGEAFEPELRCTPSAVDFGVISRERESRREVVCVNTAAHPWTLVALPMTGPDASSFGVGPIPAAPVEAGGSWRFQVTALAGGPGRLFATLPLATASGHASGSIALAAEGEARGLSCAPAVLDFGFVGPGASRVRDVVCTNYSIDPVTITALTLDASADARFRWPGLSFPIELPGRVDGVTSTASLPVEFTPTLDDDGSRRTGRLTIVTDDPALELGVQLTGFAGGPRIACSPASLDFGVVARDLPATRSFVCTNAGSDDPTRPDDVLLLTDITSSDPTEFTASVRDFVPEAGLRIGETFTVDVTYNPVDDGLDRGTIRLFGNATNDDGAGFGVEVVGTGRALPPCDFDVVPSFLRFGIVDRGAAATLEFGVKNRRVDAECLIQGLRLAATCDPAFSLPAGDVALEVLPPAGELRIPVRFAPGRYQLDAFTCDVLFDITTPDNPHQVVRALGASQEPCAIIAPVDYDFGMVKQGCSSRTHEFQILNVCSRPIAPTVELNEGPSDEFSLVSVSPAGTLLGPGESTTFRVGYGPRNDGVDLGSVLVGIPGTPEPYLVTFRARSSPDASQLDSFAQNDRPKVDVLMVIDNSGGMSTEQAGLAANLRPFLSFAQAQEIDYQVGVTTTGLANPCGNPGGAGGAEDGRLFPVDNSRPRILTPNTPNMEAVWSANVQVGQCQAIEQPLEGAYRALTPPVSDTCDDPRHPEPNDGNCGFLRPQAHLSILAVTDEADGSAGTVDFYHQALQALKGTRNTHLFNFHAITGPRGTGCTSAGGSAEAGDKLIDLVERTDGGLFQSICTSDWATTLRNMSPGVFGTKTCFFLRGPPEDTNGNGVVSAAEGELEVRLNGMAVAPVGPQGQAIWRYNASQVAVCFEPMAAPEPGTQLDVEYRVACLTP